VPQHHRLALLVGQPRDRRLEPPRQRLLIHRLDPIPATGANRSAASSIGIGPSSEPCRELAPPQSIAAAGSR
jgi:hypothetical protein